jgi:hypothetical protein
VGTKNSPSLLDFPLGLESVGGSCGSYGKLTIGTGGHARAAIDESGGDVFFGVGDVIRVHLDIVRTPGCSSVDLGRNDGLELRDWGIATRGKVAAAASVDAIGRRVNER